MKFEIYGKEFKELIDRISGIVPKKTSICQLETVKITAKNNNKIEIQASDMTQYATITAYANVYEVGETWVYLSDLRKVLGITDDIIVTTCNGKFEVRSKKKSYEITCHDDYGDMFAEFPKLENNNILCMQKELVFLKHLSLLNCMRCENESNKILTGFYIDLPNKKIVAIDGHRIGIAKIDDGMISPNAMGLLIDGHLYSGLKSIIGKNKNDSDRLEIYADKKYVWLIGHDFNYIIRILDGEYYQYEKLINNNFDYTYKFDKKELSAIAKEYGKVINANNMKPMIFYSDNGKVATGIEVDNYRTSDILESAEFTYGSGEFYVGFNPKFILDACGMFDGEAEMCGTYKSNCPVVIKDDVYTALILPVNIMNASTEFVKKQVA